MKLLFSAILITTCSSAFAQDLHITAFGGFANYQGDLQDKRFTTQQGHAALGAGLYYEITNKIGLRANATFATISSSDQTGTKYAERNLSFSSPKTDVHLGLEYNLLDIYDKGFSPYIFAGISFFHFNPSTIDSAGKKVFLQPLGTEGQGFYLNRKKYSLNQLSIPFGGGVKLALGENVRVGLEIGLRKTNTDYLDDVSTTYVDHDNLAAQNGAEAASVAYRGDELKNGSAYPSEGTQRGGAKAKDWYYFSGVTLSFRLHKNENGGSGRSSHTGCPANMH
jgi:hypothetical protein